ncbi:MAG: transketolase [Chloroflexi bacterium]|nr:transketolase [Chloroflexota bacterium]
MTDTALDSLSVNTLRFLAADGVQNANSGHPGLPMGTAAMAYTLWTRFLKHNPAKPRWPDRDRFVLSGGHGSMLLYSLLHLTGYDLSLDDLKSFRQWGSRTPGHPEVHLTPGVEATTGPLGQGISSAVGMAMAEAHLAARFNRDGHTIVDHYTYVLASDGDLMEGVAAEACSLAGHLRLGKLIVLYDDNKISLAGSTSLTFAEDVGLRFAAYGWQVLRVSDGNDVAAIEQAIHDARKVPDQPTLILIRTIIGYGSPHKQNTFEAHGSPLGPDELKAAKQNLGFPSESMFHIPDEALKNFRSALEGGKKSEADWGRRFASYAKAHPTLAAEFQRRMSGDLPSGWDAALPSFPADAKGLATRKASEAAMQTIAKSIPELIGGSADLNPSTFTWLKGEGDFESPLSSPEGAQGAVGGGWGHDGRNVHFGVREHGMGAIVNGMALHGGLRPYGATFFVFSDYMRPSIRLAALSDLPCLFVFTHDSIGVGEDGPTHQPIEHLAALRAIPNLITLRPCDANETIEAWRFAVAHRHGPVALVFTRQNLPTLDRSVFAPAAELAKGGYVLNYKTQFPNSKPDVILMATGSEVELILKAGEKLAAEGVNARLVSMPSWELFEKQSQEYRDSVLPPDVRARVAVEAGVRQGWDRYLGERGAFVGLDRFGASAPAKVVFEKLGLTADAVATAAKRLLG